MFAFSLLRSINIARSRSLEGFKNYNDVIPSIAIFVPIDFADMPRTTNVIGQPEPSHETTITGWSDNLMQSF